LPQELLTQAAALNPSIEEIQRRLKAVDERLDAEAGMNSRQWD
jgi:hypothetical protein